MSQKQTDNLIMVSLSRLSPEDVHLKVYLLLLHVQPGKGVNITSVESFESFISVAALMTINHRYQLRPSIFKVSPLSTNPPRHCHLICVSVIISCRYNDSTPRTGKPAHCHLDLINLPDLLLNRHRSARICLLLLPWTSCEFHSCLLFQIETFNQKAPTTRAIVKGGHTHTQTWESSFRMKWARKLALGISGDPETPNALAINPFWWSINQGPKVGENSSFPPIPNPCIDQIDSNCKRKSLDSTESW